MTKIKDKKIKISMNQLKIKVKKKIPMKIMLLNKKDTHLNF